MLLVLDNGSAYTGRLTDFLRDSGHEFVATDHAGLDLERLDDFDSFILSGRRANDRQMNRANSVIVRHAASKGRPLLGICYGAEIMAITLGGTIGRIDSAQTGPQTVQVHRDNPLCSGIVSVFESHHYEIRCLGKLESLASSDSCRHELVRFGPVMYGCQFHPEMSADGRDIIERFCRL